MIEQEPVGWINKHNLESIAQEGAGNVWNKPYFDGDIPLYTHPMRELSDEEINQLWAESHEDGIAMKQCFTTQQHYFAHLILQKASKK